MDETNEIRREKIELPIEEYNPTDCKEALNYELGAFEELIACQKAILKNLELLNLSISGKIPAYNS